MARAPLLSVIIPVRNRERYLREAVLSVFEGGLSPETIEVIIVDDASTDRSLDSIRDLEVQTIRLPRSLGVAHARNVGIAASRAEQVTFLDSDDRMAEGSLLARLQWLRLHPDSAAVAGRIGKILDAEGAVLFDAKRVLYPKGWTEPSRVSLASWRDTGCLFFPSWCVVFRRETLQRVGPFDESIEIAVEREFVYRLLRQSDVDFLPIAAVHYRWHLENLSLLADPESALGFIDRPKSIAERFLVDAAYAAELA